MFAATFLLMFGSMFGDVGQGAIIAGLAWYLRDKLGRFYPFGVMAGISSICFGFLFGSVFGYEHLLPALWMSPLHDPMALAIHGWLHLDAPAGEKIPETLGRTLIYLGLAEGIAIYGLVISILLLNKI